MTTNFHRYLSSETMCSFKNLCNLSRAAAVWSNFKSKHVTQPMLFHNYGYHQLISKMGSYLEWSIRFYVGINNTPEAYLEPYQNLQWSFSAFG